MWDIRLDMERENPTDIPGENPKDTATEKIVVMMMATMMDIETLRLIQRQILYCQASSSRISRTNTRAASVLP